MKKILNRLSLVIGISLLLLVNVHAQDVCNRPDPNIYENGGVSFFSECRNGMGFPVFNVYNDWPIYPGFNDEEFNFLRTRIESPEAESQPRWGFRDNVRISNDGQITRLKMRVHNGGNANLNNRGDVIARDVRLKVNGFTRAEDGSWIHEPDRIDPTTNTAFHIISATLSASNTTPNTLEDTVTIRTNADKVLKLYQNRRDTDFGLGIIKMCTSRFELNEETGDYICIDANGDGDQDYEPNKFTASNIVSGRGLNLQSVPQGVSGNLFYASEGYKQNISVFVVTDL